VLGGFGHKKSFPRSYVLVWYFCYGGLFVDRKFNSSGDPVAVSQLINCRQE